MSELALFVLRPELEELIREFVGRYDLNVCTGHGRQDYGGFEVESNGEFLMDLGNRQLFLIPKEPSVTDLKNVGPIYPRYLGWTSITVGGLVDNEESGIIAMSKFSTENHKGLGFDPSYRLRAFGKTLSEDHGFTFGTKGINMVSGGSAIYKNIGYSQASKQLHERGVVWKQFATGNVKFDPMS